MVTRDVIFDYLDLTQRKIGPLEVPDWWSAFRDVEAGKYNGGRRTWEERQVDADCLLPEIMLQRNGYVDLPTCWRHDAIYKGAKIDFKLIRKWFNVSEKSRNQYMESILLNELDYFAFYKYKVDYYTPLVTGNIVDYDLWDIVPAREVIKNLEVSKRPSGGWFYCVQDLRNVVELA